MSTSNDYVLYRETVRWKRWTHCMPWMWLGNCREKYRWALSDNSYNNVVWKRVVVGLLLLLWFITLSNQIPWLLPFLGIYAACILYLLLLVPTHLTSSQVDAACSWKAAMLMHQMKSYRDIALCPLSAALFRFVRPRHMNTHFLTVPWGRIPEVRTSLQYEFWGNDLLMASPNLKREKYRRVMSWAMAGVLASGDDISWYFLSNYSRRIAAFCVCESSFSGTFCRSGTTPLFRDNIDFLSPTIASDSISSLDASRLLPLKFIVLHYWTMMQRPIHPWYLVAHTTLDCAENRFEAKFISNLLIFNRLTWTK